ncbi:hypothetical protein GCM10009094_05320 [Massilia aurea]
MPVAGTAVFGVNAVTVLARDVVSLVASPPPPPQAVSMTVHMAVMSRVLVLRTSTSAGCSAKFVSALADNVVRVFI